MQAGCDISPLRRSLHCEGSARVDSKDAAFFGADGAGFRDLLDAVNPLNQLPVISGMMQAAIGREVSTASRLLGGVLFGGPIGFIASLAGVIFEDAVGSSPVAAVYAALTNDAPLQVAAAALPASQLASAATPDNAGISAAVKAVTQTAALALENDDGLNSRNKVVLELYGGSGVSAHNSYKKSHMLSYLHDVGVSRVI